MKQLIEKMNLKNEWKLIGVSLLFLLISARLFTGFLPYHELRVDQFGWKLHDPLYEILPHFDLSILIFIVTYGGIIVYGVTSYQIKNFLPKILLTYGLICLFRIVALYLLPLKEQPTLIYLQDPFLNNMVYPGRIVRDLFFSGHTALLFGMYLASGKRLILLIMSIVLGFSLIIQHVHYSIDVVVAIPITYFCYGITEFVLEKLNGIKFLKVS
ncbi:MAG: phosphatase PAP2-related protein [Bacteroidota bacterium]